MYNLVAALRLNDQGFTRGLHAAARNMNSFGSRARSLSSEITGFAAKLGAAALAAKGLETTMKGAMQMETDKLTLGALVNDTEKANKLFDMLQQKGLKSVFSDADFMGAGKAFLPITKDLGQINKLLGVTERLASSNTLEGMTGASFAIREALSGDLVSLQERFNIPRSTLKAAFKGAETSTAKIAALDKVLNGLGFTQQFVNKVNTSSSAQWQTLESNVTTAMAKMGGAALEKLKKPLTDINNWIQGGGLNGLKELGSNYLATAVTKAVEFGSYIKNNWPQIKQNFADLNAALAPIKEGLGLIVDGAKNVVKWMASDWKRTIDIVLSLGGAFVTLRAGLTGLMIVGVVTKLIRAYREATLIATLTELGFNAALWANPWTWVVVGVAALVGAIIYLARNFDAVKEKTRQLWDKLGAFKGVATIVLGPLGLIIRAAVTMAEQWDSTKGVWENVWNGIKIAASNAVNDVIGSINWLIKKINKIPGVSIPLVARVSWGDKLSEKGNVVSGAGASRLRGQLPSHAGGLNYVYKDQYPALLHKGEAVLPRHAADEWRSGKGRGNVYNIGGIHINGTGSTEKDAQKMFEIFVSKVEAAGNAGA